MDLSRRDFFKLSRGAVTGTAQGDVAGLGASLVPALALAQELRRIKVRRWRPARFSPRPTASRCGSKAPSCRRMFEE